MTIGSDIKPHVPLMTQQSDDQRTESTFLQDTHSCATQMDSETRVSIASNSVTNSENQYTNNGARTVDSESSSSIPNNARASEIVGSQVTSCTSHSPIHPCSDDVIRDVTRSTFESLTLSKSHSPVMETTDGYVKFINGHHRDGCYVNSEQALGSEELTQPKTFELG